MKCRFAPLNRHDRGNKNTFKSDAPHPIRFISLSTDERADADRNVRRRNPEEVLVGFPRVTKRWQHYPRYVERTSGVRFHRNAFV